MTGSFGRGLAAGVYGLGRSAGDFLHFLGAEKTGQGIYEHFKKKTEENQIDADLQGKSVANDPSILKDPDWWLYNVGQSLPSTVASLLVGGGAGAAAKGVGLGMKAATVAGSLAAGATGGALEGASTYRQALDEGKSETEARLEAVGMGLATGALNAIPAFQLFKPGVTAGGTLGNKLLRAGLKAGSQALWEGATEAAEEPVESIITGKPVTEGLKRSLDVFGPAALTGAVTSVSPRFSEAQRVVVEDYVNNPIRSQAAGPDYLSETMAIQNVPDDVAAMVDRPTTQQLSEQLRQRIAEDRVNVTDTLREGQITPWVYEESIKDSDERLNAVRKLEARTGVAPLEDEVRSAYEFFSNNEEEDMDFPRAVEILTSPRHTQFRTLAQDIDAQMGLEFSMEDAVGDWVDGAENSLAEFIPNVGGDDLTYNAAWKGLVGHQKAILTFQKGEGGPDTLYSMDLPDSVEAARQTLTERGIQFHTLIPKGTRTRVMVFDQGNTLLPNVQEVADHYGIEVEAHTGQGSFLGGDSREDAANIFRDAIRSYEEGNHPLRYRPPRGVRTDRDFTETEVTELSFAEPDVTKRKEMKNYLEKHLSDLNRYSDWTESHSLGVAKIVRELGQFLGFDADRLTLATMASLLHDEGKLDVPKSILDKANKLSKAEEKEFNTLIDKSGKTEEELRRQDYLASQLGRFTEEERSAIKAHTEAGETRLTDAPGLIGIAARALARRHHDSPQQIRELIDNNTLTPEQGALLSVIKLADAFESMSGVDRPYALYDNKQHVIERSRGNALEVLVDSPEAFDPAITKAMVALQLRDHAEQFTREQKAYLRQKIGMTQKPLSKEELNVSPKTREMVRRNAFSRAHAQIQESSIQVSNAQASMEVVETVGKLFGSQDADQDWAPVINSAHREVLAASFRDLFDAGLPRQIVNLVNRVGVLKGTDHAAFNSRNHIMGFNEEILQAAKEAPMTRSLRAVRFDVAHELGHAVDYLTGRSVAMASPLFQMSESVVSDGNVDTDKMGPVIRELYEAYAENKGGLRRLLHYPFYKLSGKAEDNYFVQREAVGQLMGLYYEYPAAAQKYLPEGVKLMEGIKNALQTQRNADLESAIRGAFQASGAGVGGETDGGVGNSPIIAAITGDRIPGTPLPGSSQAAGKPGGGTAAPPALKTLGAVVGEQEMPGAAKREVRPHDLTKAIADRLGASPVEVDKFARRNIGRAFNAEELAQAVTLLDKTSSDFQKFTREYVTRIKEGRASDLDDQAFTEQRLNFATIQAQFVGVSGEAGRALNILRLAKDQASRAELIRQTIGSSSDIRNQAQLIDALPLGSQASVVRETLAPTKMDKFMEIWINGLLSGPQTHVANTVSNAIVSALEDVERFVGATFGKLHGGDKVTFGEALNRVYGNIDGTVAGLAAMAKALRSEDAIDLFGKVEGGAYKKAIPGAIGKIVRGPGRFLNAEDMFYKALTVSKEYRALAMREAQLTGRSFQDLLTNPDDTLMEKAWSVARTATFTNELGDIGQAVQRVLSKHPYMRLIAPFIKTPSNIVKFVLKRTPAGLLFHDVQSDIKAGGAARDMALARIATGTSIGAAIFSLTLAGMFTGKGPDDPNQKRLLYQTGWQPYSVKIGDTYVSYSRLEPFGMLVGMAADMAEMAQVMEEKEAGELMAMFVGSFAKNMTSKTYLRGLSEMMEAMSDPDRYGKQWIMNYAGTAVPTGIAQLARSRDPYLRRADNIMDKIKERIPGLRETLPEKVDLFGKPIKVEGSIGPDLLSVLYMSTQKDDPVSQEMLRLGIFKSGVSKKLAGVDLTQEEYAEYQRIAGRLARDHLQRMVGSTGWKSLSDKDKEDMIRKIFDMQRKEARKQILAKFPDIERRKAAQ